MLCMSFVDSSHRATPIPRSLMQRFSDSGH
jgi:hypothetical protein